MKKTILALFIAFSLLLIHVSTFSQELEDINTITRPISTVFTTKYGIIVFYPGFDLDSRSLYLPNSWFQPLNLRNKPNEESNNIAPIYAKIQNIYKNINSPFLKLIFSGNQLKEIEIYLTKNQIEKPAYLPQDLQNLQKKELIEPRFKDQESKNYIILE